MKKIVLGMMALALTFSAMSQTNNNSNQGRKDGDERSFRGGGNLDKLNLTDAQKAQMKTINESFRQQMQDLRKQGNITVDEQKQKREALMKEHREKLAAILTPEQRKQAVSIREERKEDRMAERKDDKAEDKMQDRNEDRIDGARGDRFEGVSKDLNLTPEQSSKMASINSAFRTSLQSIRQNGTLTKEQKRDQMKSLMKQHQSDMESLLTDDQKQQLKSRQKNRLNRTVVK
ncbi:MAG: Spy/CpxP family protein refolding chaperone [Bacteroidota bacterium]|nr:Spy/CpxP family protein refolding chaperone [Bacteroidota bacterium]